MSEQELATAKLEKLSEKLQEQIKSIDYCMRTAQPIAKELGYCILPNGQLIKI